MDSARVIRMLAGVALIGGGALVVSALLSDDSPTMTTAATATTSDADTTAPSNSVPAPTVQTTVSPDSGPPTAVSPESIPVLGDVPELRGIDEWMNSDIESLEEILANNDVTIAQFWTFGCRNCKATLDNMRGIYSDFGGEGLEIVGVHSPEFSFEADPDNIAQALIDLDISWPVALDTEKENFHRWQPGNTGFWPRTYVIDGEGNVRFDHVGEGKYDELRVVVTQLLAEAA
jgi:thiol-disulfide isomerase/thioredoxin